MGAVAMPHLSALQRKRLSGGDILGHLPAHYKQGHLNHGDAGDGCQNNVSPFTSLTHFLLLTVSI